MNNETILNAFIKAVQNRDVTEVGKLIAENIIFENMPEQQAIHGRQAVLEKIADFFAQASRIQWQIERKISFDNTVILERKNHICFQGKDIILPVVSVIEFQNDKVSLLRDYFDALTFNNQYNAS